MNYIWQGLVLRTILWRQGVKDAKLMRCEWKGKKFWSVRCSAHGEPLPQYDFSDTNKEKCVEMINAFLAKTEA